ncbi:DUF2750 domain-containing protein [Alkanindiges illinoisensis]|uniref:DUF2750 domain-containing protein n=1 Tax=Alkanindiges illinoisensis TaxID=197183 RepID=A0A4Y7XDU1_9GAMM|nr:DUF2750 domain-containing protein [Alkanindiges illinoisensis]TEU29281.1 DUF2750 domain-containing protein [Alkanindiges illinoisensis]
MENFAQTPQLNMLELDAKARYRYFIQKIIAKREVWGLYHDGWAMSGTVGGKMALPLWPDAKYARLCNTRNWAKHQVQAMSLKTFVEELIPLLIEKQCMASVFLTPDWNSVLVEPERLLADIKSYVYACFQEEKNHLPEQVSASQAKQDLPAMASTSIQ